MPKALGVDIFAGGFTVGVSQHFDVLAHFEEGSYGVATCRLNFPDLPIFVGHSDWPVEDPKYHELDFIYGNPPCAAWSQANALPFDNWRTDDRVDYTRRHFELLEKLHPKVWTWESVAAAFAKGREFIDELAAAALAQGYAVTLFLHDGQYHGIPQTRKRFFFIAHRVKFHLDAPDWSFETCGEALRKINDVGELYGSAVQSTVRNAELLPHVNPGEDLRQTFDRLNPDLDKCERNHLGHVKGRPGFLVKRSYPDRVAYTVVSEQVHPTERRFLTLRELGALCGYPADWQLAPPANQMQELSRGVCPPVAEYLARMVAKAVKANEPVTEPSVCVVDYTKPPGHTYQVVDGPPSPAGAPPTSRVAHKPVDRMIARAPAASGTSGSDFETSRARTMTSGDVQTLTRSAVGIPRPKPGVKRMAFLQVLIMMDRWTPSQMVEIIKHQWPVSKASNADVSTQRAVLRQKGYTCPPTRRQPAEALPWA